MLDPQKLGYGCVDRHLASLECILWVRYVFGVRSKLRGWLAGVLTISRGISKARCSRLAAFCELWIEQLMVQLQVRSIHRMFVSYEWVLPVQ
jgi:hypothetical protein